MHRALVCQRRAFWTHASVCGMLPPRREERRLCLLDDRRPALPGGLPLRQRPLPRSSRHFAQVDLSDRHRRQRLRRRWGRRGGGGATVVDMSRTSADLAQTATTDMARVPCAACRRRLLVAGVLLGHRSGLPSPFDIPFLEFPCFLRMKLRATAARAWRVAALVDPVFVGRGGLFVSASCRSSGSVSRRSSTAALPRRTAAYRRRRRCCPCAPGRAWPAAFTGATNVSTPPPP